MRTTRRRLAALLVIAAFLVGGAAPLQQPARAAAPTPTGSLVASSATMPPPFSTKIKWMNVPPPVSSSMQQSLEARLNATLYLPPPVPPSSDVAPAGPSGVQSDAFNGSSAYVLSPSEPTLFTNRTDNGFGTRPYYYASEIDEPSVANHGRTVLFTGNWYASMSRDGGLTWAYVAPWTIENNSYFCCDQDVIFDPHYGMFIWSMLGWPTTIGVSKDLTNWWFYHLPGWLDYPHLALSSDYVYLTAMSYWGGVVFQLPLLPMSAGQGFDFLYFLTENDWNPLGVQGAASTMYFGTHNFVWTGHGWDRSVFRIYSWTDNSSMINFYDRTIPAYTWFRYNYRCPSPNGYNACGWDDDRVKAGWVSGNELGFAWDAGWGYGFPYPYVDVVIFDLPSLDYLSNPYIYSMNYAWMYPSITVNARGDLGFEAFISGNGHYPSLQIGMSDAQTGAPPPWHFYWGRTGEGTGTNGFPNRWGDYMTVRQFDSASNAWVAAGYTVQPGNAVEPRYYVFGQAGDNPYLPSPIG